MSSKPITKLEEVRNSHNVVAAVRDAEAARDAIESLERNGVDGSRIALLGSIDSSAGTPRLRGAIGRVGRLFLAGFVLGAIVGATAGWLSGIGGSAAPLLWGLFGALGGAFVVAVSSFGVSRAWWRTFEGENAGTLAVGVHTDDPDEADVAARVLEATSPLSINQF
ncbi:MAG: hypothetical protein WD532_06230 [Acidimicrobiia bacterium]